VVDHSQDRFGDPLRDQERVGKGEEAEADPEPALHDLKKDEDRCADGVGDVAGAERQGLARGPSQTALTL
jgi:hypothetical protein